MTEERMAQHIKDSFPGVEAETNFGYTFFFYGAERKLPFATIASSDNEHDNVSNLNRPDVFRLNIGVSRDSFRSLFGTDAIETGAYDYTALDRIMPHPDYAPQYYICVLNPGESTFGRISAVLAEAYELAKVRAAKRPQRVI
jgi:hypothetical protein